MASKTSQGDRRENYERDDESVGAVSPTKDTASASSEAGENSDEVEISEGADTEQGSEQANQEVVAGESDETSADEELDQLQGELTVAAIVVPSEIPGDANGEEIPVQPAVAQNAEAKDLKATHPTPASQSSLDVEEDTQLNSSTESVITGAIDSEAATAAPHSSQQSAAPNKGARQAENVKQTNENGVVSIAAEGEPPVIEAEAALDNGDGERREERRSSGNAPVASVAGKNEAAELAPLDELSVKPEAAATPQPADAAARPESPSPPSQPSTGADFTLVESSGESATNESSATNRPETSGVRVDASRFITRVARAFQAADERGGTVQLRLSPPELGAMKIELSVQQGTLTAKLETETTAAKNVLLDNLPALRERLAAQDIRVDKFEVDVREQGSGGQPDWQAGQNNRSPQGRQPVNRPTIATLGVTSETPRRTFVQVTPDGRLNVVA